MNIIIRRFFVMVTITLLVSGSANYLTAAQDLELPDGSRVQLPVTCPVCEMKIESDSAVMGASVFADGKVVLFDNISEFLRYLLSPQTFGFEMKNIKRSFVLEHHSDKFIEAKDAFYVIGPEVTAVMGPETFALSDREAADKIASGSRDKKVLAFHEVSLQDVSPRKKILRLKPSEAPKNDQMPVQRGHSSH